MRSARHIFCNVAEPFGALARSASVGAWSQQFPLTAPSTGRLRRSKRNPGRKAETRGPCTGRHDRVEPLANPSRLAHAGGGGLLGYAEISCSCFPAGVSWRRDGWLHERLLEPNGPRHGYRTVRTECEDHGDA